MQDALEQTGFACQVIEFPESTHTAQEAADRVDETRIGLFADEPIGRADADFVRTVTGFAIGGVPPLGHTKPMETYLDEDFFQYPSLWAAAGTPNAVFEPTPADLLKMTGGKVMKVR
ncbi:MAG: YbaK/EbsC family protein [Chloroflexi bacterium]|nr:YbaK/EbsC family protein [Chloroflexota bacterium]